VEVAPPQEFRPGSRLKTTGARSHYAGGLYEKKFHALAAFAVAGTCIVLAMKVTADYNHAVDFSKYKTYSWLKVEAGNPLWVDRISNAVDSPLTLKGWTKVESGGDASVAAFGSTHHQPRLETFYDDFGGGWYWRGFGHGMAITTVEEIPIRTLVVDIFDAQTKNEKKLLKATDMFKHFPLPPIKVSQWWCEGGCYAQEGHQKMRPSGLQSPIAGQRQLRGPFVQPWFQAFGQQFVAQIGLVCHHFRRPANKNTVTEPAGTTWWSDPPSIAACDCTGRTAF